MSDHFSAANLKYPGGDARLDLTDLFVFSPPAACGRTVLITGASPFLAGPEFHPCAVYRINVDNDGDLHADVAFTFIFSPPAEGPQVMTAYYATGRLARQREPVGEVLVAAAPVGFDASAQPVQAGQVRLFAGLRSAPFFAGTTIVSIALEVPDEMLGAGPQIGVWATISLRCDGTLVPLDRGGHPAAAAAGTVLPGVLRYDRGRPAAYPNGRNLTDNVSDARMALLTNGTVSSDRRRPHDDLLAEFPYLGPPNP
jgi:uncharacterized protein DUF4331